MKVFLMILTIFVSSITAFFVSTDRHDRWLIMNGEFAENYISQIENRNYTPDRFIDYTIIITDDDHVIFSTHNSHQDVYVYSSKKHPENVASDMPLSILIPIGGNWYLDNG